MTNLPLILPCDLCFNFYIWLHLPQTISCPISTVNIFLNLKIWRCGTNVCMLPLPQHLRIQLHLKIIYQSFFLLLNNGFNKSQEDIFLFFVANMCRALLFRFMLLICIIQKVMIGLMWFCSSGERHLCIIHVLLFKNVKWWTSKQMKVKSCLSDWSLIFVMNNIKQFLVLVKKINDQILQ